MISSIRAIDTATTTSIVTRTSEAPSAFSLTYTEAPSTTQHGYISEPSDHPNCSGMLTAFKQEQARSTSFTLNTQRQLVTNARSLVTEKNTRDPFPYLFLDNVTSAADTPTFSVCNGVLRADYPDTQGNGFALCNGFLSLGVDSVFTGPCQRINLGFGELRSL
jgi:hypothetical protein